MRIADFRSLKIGDRFKRFSATSVAVFTKVDDDYEIDPSSSYPIPNSNSELGSDAFKLSDPVFVLTDEEVVEAKKLEHNIRVGQKFSNHVIFNRGEVYVRIEVIKPARSTSDVEKIFR